MSFLLIAVAGGFGLFFLMAIIFFFANKGRYPYKAIVIAQVGSSEVVLQDSFRVYQTEGGFYALEFKKHRDIKGTSPAYKLWTLFSRGEGKQNDELLSADDNNNTYSRDEIKKILVRGAIFYKTSEGSVKPVVIQKGELTVIDQDDRAFIADEERQKAEMMQSGWQKALPYIIGVVTVVVCVGAAIFAMIYINNTLGETIANICGNVASAANSNINISNVPLVGA